MHYIISPGIYSVLNELVLSKVHQNVFAVYHVEGYDLYTIG